MAEFTEVLEDFGQEAKSLFKNKKFWLLVGGVGIIALVAGYKKNQSSDLVEGTDGVVGYAATGYTGYPTTGGGTTDYIEESYDTTFDTLFTNIDDLSETMISVQEGQSALLSNMEKQNDISQMKANSDLYNTITDKATKDALHAENEEIAKKYGWKFDKESGNWFDGSSVVYLSTSQSAALTEKGVNTSDEDFMNNSAFLSAMLNAVLKGTEAETPAYVKDVEEKKETTKKSTSGGSSKVSENPAKQYETSTWKFSDNAEVKTSSSGTHIYDDGVYGIASDGKAIKLVSSNNPSGKSSVKKGSAKSARKSASMARDTSRAGTTITAGGYNVTYDDKGYAVKKVKIK